MPFMIPSKLLFLLIFCLFLESCTRDCPQYKHAKAVLEPVDDSGVRGVVIFSEEARGIRIIAEFSGLTPGDHGLHVHEFGDCSGKGAENAGGHFNPGHTQHGGPHDSPGHVGDLGNVRANSSGRARLDRMDFVISLDGTESILGKSVIIHKFRDDYLTQPSGNTGPGVACGLIFPTE